MYVVYQKKSIIYANIYFHSFILYLIRRIVKKPLWLKGHNNKNSEKDLCKIPIKSDNIEMAPEVPKVLNIKNFHIKQFLYRLSLRKFDFQNILV